MAISYITVYSLLTALLNHCPLMTWCACRQTGVRERTPILLLHCNKYHIYVIQGCHGKGISILIPTPLSHDSILEFHPLRIPDKIDSHAGFRIQLYLNLWTGETRIHQKYGKFRSAISWNFVFTLFIFYIRYFYTLFL